ncbi:hypothetical protein C8R44DRAFT_859185 [Mycena epipterygia]|nr:hypothetical protein C8R44DRAFT_859185 [Mycena epipterygia]
MADGTTYSAIEMTRRDTGHASIKCGSKHNAPSQNAGPKEDAQPTQKHTSRARHHNTTPTRQPADVPNPQEIAQAPNRATLDPRRTSHTRPKKAEKGLPLTAPLISEPFLREEGIACGGRRDRPLLARARGHHLPHRTRLRHMPHVSVSAKGRRTRGVWAVPVVKNKIREDGPGERIEWSSSRPHVVVSMHRPNAEHVVVAVVSGCDDREEDEGEGEVLVAATTAGHHKMRRAGAREGVESRAFVAEDSQKCVGGGRWWKEERKDRAESYSSSSGFGRRTKPPPLSAPDTPLQDTRQPARAALRRREAGVGYVTLEIAWWAYRGKARTEQR